MIYMLYSNLNYSNQSVLGTYYVVVVYAVLYKTINYISSKESYMAQVHNIITSISI